MNISQAYKKSQIFSAVAIQDIEELKSLLSSPEWYTIENESGFNLLQHTIIETNQEVFDFLLTINGFPLDATSSTKTTALITSITKANDEYYALELIKKGANVRSLDDKGNTLLHLAVQRAFTQSCHLLLEKGLDVNAENNEGQTPFEMLPLIPSDQVVEIMYILLYYNADVFPPHNRCFGIYIFEQFLITIDEDWLFLEILFNYAIDDYSNYEINSDTLFNFMKWFPNCPLFYEIMNKTRNVIENNLPDCASYLFLIDNNYMKLLVEKFDYLIKKMLKCCGYSIFSPIYFDSESFANFAVLLESRVIDDTIKFANYLGISEIIKGFKEWDCITSNTEDLICYILPYLSTISCEDMNLVYRQFGYGDLFKTLLHMNIDINYSIYDVMPGIIFDLNFDLGKYFYYHILSIDPNRDGFPEKENYETGCTVGGLDKLLNYFADPRVKNFCYKQHIKQLVLKAKKLPQVPLLQELARESCRKFLVQKYNVTTSRQFYTILDRLPISNTHKKIISYETPLYYV